ncbi:MAG TPA: membrane protein [Thermomicrobiaceae bacterium]|nr:membrane protein [Thermomicrobiaceae bacterium]
MRSTRGAAAATGQGRRAAQIGWQAPSLRRVRDWSLAEWLRWFAQLAVLLAGLALFALGLVLSLQSNLGATSWTVFQDGISRHTPLTIGQASQLVGLIMIGVSWLGGIRPGIGTVLNMFLVGFLMDVILEHGWVPLAQAFPARAGMLVAAIVILGLATGLYIKAGFGAGPRDSFNLVMVRLTGRSIGLTRWGIESTVVVIGIVLGGRFGPGTILAALLIGPAVGLGFRVVGLSRADLVAERPEEADALTLVGAGGTGAATD